MPVAGKGRGFLNNAWKAHKNMGKKKKIISPISREQEIEAMEKFIAVKGATICSPNNPQDSQSLFQNHPIQVMS